MGNRGNVPPIGMSGRLQVAMGKADKSIMDLVRITGMSRNTITAYVYGENAMDVTTCMKVCKALRVTPNWLICGKE